VHIILRAMAIIHTGKSRQQFHTENSVLLGYDNALTGQ